MQVEKSAKLEVNKLSPMEEEKIEKISNIKSVMDIAADEIEATS